MQNRNFKISGNIVDVVAKRIFTGTVLVENGKIKSIVEETVSSSQYILPGFIDAHVHVESSMLIPSEFARLAVVHGTVGTISDPHEIGNVLGIDGVKYMIENGKKVPFKFHFGAPSCVPATSFETAGAEIGPDGIEELMAMDEVVYLAEMMNFPGVLFEDPVVMKKLAIAKKHNKPIDGHAPGLRGDDAKKYISHGISTDHECFTKEEALDKLKHGMKIIIREGSAAKNYTALHTLIGEYPEMIMFCSDDKHPDNLAISHINELVKRSFDLGYDKMDVLRCASFNVVKHYGLNVGLLQQGDPADFIVADDLENLDISATYIDGEKIAENGQTFIESVKEDSPNHFNCSPIEIDDMQVEATSDVVRAIAVEDGQLITKEEQVKLPVKDGKLQSDIMTDTLKMVVLNRYKSAPCAVSFARCFGLKKGAIASTVAHDSHNIIAVGTNDEDIKTAINLLVKSQGGVSLANGNDQHVLPLPVAGLMAADDGYEVAKAYEELDKKSKALGATLSSPYMTLSFCALLVIPELKLSDKGLFDGTKFQFTSVCV